MRAGCGRQRGELGGGQPVLCAELDPLNQLRSGDEQSGEVPGVEPDRYQRSCAGKQRAAGDSEAAAIRGLKRRWPGEVGLATVSLFSSNLGGSNFLRAMLAKGLLLVVAEGNWKVTWALLD